MNQEKNNFNMQGNNGMTNNQPVNINTNMYQQQLVNQNTNMYQQQSFSQTSDLSKNKKFKWWIPVLFFVGGFLMSLCNLIVTLIIKSQNNIVVEADLLKNPIIMFFRLLTVICWIMVIPSLIFVIIKYNTKTSKEKNQE